jgi:hypothetical protein
MNQGRQSSQGKVRENVLNQATAENYCADKENEQGPKGPFLIAVQWKESIIDYGPNHCRWRAV